MLPWFMSYNATDYIALNAPSDTIADYVRSFLADGYVIIPQGISREQALDTGKFYQEFKSLNSSIFSKHFNDQGCLQRLVNFHLLLKPFRELFVKNVVALEVMDYLFGARAALYTSLIFEQGSEQPLHRDTPVFCTRPEYRYFGLWVPLEDVDHENGPLRVVRGAHLMPELDRISLAKRHYQNLADVPTGDNVLWDEYQAAVARQCEQLHLAPSELYLSAGDTVIWHPQLLHGGSPHRDLTRSRLSFVMHITPFDVPVYHMDKFFDPKREAPTPAPWDFLPIGDRFYADQGQMLDIAHKEIVPISDFRLPEMASLA